MNCYFAGYDLSGAPFFGIPKKDIPQGLYYIRNVEDSKDLIAVHPVSREELQRYFYYNVATNHEFIDKEGIDESFLDRGILEKGLALGHTTGLSKMEMSLLYNMVKKISPDRVLEFSCGSGWSTTTTSKALMDLGKIPVYFETHDIDPARILETKNTLNDNNVDFVTLKCGDVFDTMDREKLKDVDFLFVDSNHEEDFTERYVKEFFPLLKKGCWVAVHDIRYHPAYVTGETVALSKYIREQGITQYFHIEDLLKRFQLTCRYDEFEHCCRDTMFFFKV